MSEMNTDAGMPIAPDPSRIYFGTDSHAMSVLVDWTVEQVWGYVRDHDVPVNRLHREGFPSVGCAPCTRAVGPGEDVRAGRWWWESADTKECGLHVGEGGEGWGI